MANALVSDIGNLHFGPEVGVGPAKSDVAVVAKWLDRVDTMAPDLLKMQQVTSHAKSTVLNVDARILSNSVKPHSVDFVITSPPYPNEKDYTRTTRLESVILGFIKNKKDLRNLKKKDASIQYTWYLQVRR